MTGLGQILNSMQRPGFLLIFPFGRGATRSGFMPDGIPLWPIELCETSQTNIKRRCSIDPSSLNGGTGIKLVPVLLRAPTSRRGRLRLGERCERCFPGNMPDSAKEISRWHSFVSCRLTVEELGRSSRLML